MSDDEMREMRDPRCAGCGFEWSVATAECVNCGRDAYFNRVEWQSEWGRPLTYRGP